ncbi:MAG: hydroxyacid dehydrogenase [Clostridia bacterium]|nr:hydroxyacid dehydrogenase [Clostridia bacterium]
MKKIYLCTKAETVKNVYATDETVYTKDDILSDPEKFKATEFIFSTWGMPTFTEEEIKRCLPSLKAVFYGAGTVQAFARPFLNCGIKVFSAWAANAVPVAEYTVAQIVLANKGFFSSSRLAKTGDRKAASQCFHSYPGNYDVKIGIIGAGMIGKLVIDMLKRYNLEVLVFDPFLPDEKAKELGVKKVSLPVLFKECQVVSNHLANNEQTKGMLYGRLFESMLPFATFINTGRGAQVVEKDLIEVLKNRPDLTALLDVTSPEPPESDSEFYTLPNCILTPHIAGSAGNEVLRMGEYMKEEYKKFIQNEPCKYEVTLEMLKTMS